MSHFTQSRIISETFFPTNLLVSTRYWGNHTLCNKGNNTKPQ